MRATIRLIIRNGWLASPYYREFMACRDWQYPLGLAFWENRRLIAFLSLFRKSESNGFSAGEESMALRLYPELHTAIRRVLQCHRNDMLCHCLVKLAHRSPQGALILDQNEKILISNPAGREICLQWSLGSRMGGILAPGQNFSLPDEILCAIRRLRLRMLETLDAPGGSPTSLRENVTHPSDPTLNAVVEVLFPHRPSPLHLFAIVHLVRKPDSSNGKSLFFWADLCPRDYELAELVCQGLSNQEIADLQGRTLVAVKRQLNPLYPKVGVTSRARLIALLLRR